MSLRMEEDQVVMMLLLAKVIMSLSCVNHTTPEQVETVIYTY